jgi:Skp family chaperone for outer membrane proteins
MQNRTRHFIAAALSASALAAGAQGTLAEENATSMPQSQAQSTQVSEEKVSNFVDAYNDVREIHSEYAAKLQNVDDPEKAAELQQEAEQKMQEAVTSNDISVQEYQQIAQQVGQDAQLRSRIQAELNEQSDS